MVALNKKDVQVQENANRIRITLASTKVDAIERVSRDIVSKARGEKVQIAGPLRMPTKVLRLCVRKAPSGQGTSTFDRYQMRVHKRVIDIVATADVVRQIVSIRMDPSVDIDVTFSA